MKIFLMVLLMASTMSVPFVCFAGDEAGMLKPVERKLTGLYSGEYTQEKAANYIGNSEYCKAAWVYINLYEKSPEDAIYGLEGLQDYVEDIVLIIKVAFVRYSMEDPETVSVEDGQFRLDQQKFREKGHWAETLIKIFSRNMNAA